MILSKPTNLRVVEDSEDRLVVRTKMIGLWLGLLALPVFIVVLGGGLWRVALFLLAGQFTAAGTCLTGALLASAFMALFLFGFLNQRLTVTRGEVEVLSKFGPVVWKRRQVTGGMAAVGCFANDAGESSTYELEIRTSDSAVVRFGSEPGRENVDLLVQRLCLRCGLCRRAEPPPLPAAVMRPAKTITRQRSRKDRRPGKEPG